MMCLCVLLFLLHYSDYSLRLLSLSALFLTFMLSNVIYLGTHTTTDVLIGVSFGVLWFLSYLLTSSFSMRATLSRHRWPIIVAAAAVLFVLEVAEERIDEATAHPMAWRENYASYCGLANIETAADKMRNSSAYEKSALFLGLCIGMALRALAGIGKEKVAKTAENGVKMAEKDENEKINDDVINKTNTTMLLVTSDPLADFATIESTWSIPNDFRTTWRSIFSISVRAISAFAAVASFSLVKWAVRAALPAGTPREVVAYLPHVAQPIWALFVVPAVLRLVGVRAAVWRPIVAKGKEA